MYFLRLWMRFLRKVKNNFGCQHIEGILKHLKTLKPFTFQLVSTPKNNLKHSFVDVQNTSFKTSEHPQNPGFRSKANPFKAI